MDTAQWPQEIMKPMEENILVHNTTTTNTNSCSKPSSNSSSLEISRKARPQKESAVNCPRCNSTNTKFCYYNNYSLSQPRYFCKTCRRYWTEGGSLRNVPVGGGSRKNNMKRSSSSSLSSSSTFSSHQIKKLPDLVVPQNPRMMHNHEHGGQDLNLGFQPTNDFKTISELIQVPNFDGIKNNTTSAVQVSALEHLTAGITTRGMMMNSFMPIPIPDPNSVYSSSSGQQMMIPPSLNFSLDGMYGSGGLNHEGSSGRLLFPFEDLKTSTITETSTQDNVDEQNRNQNGGDANGFWSGMLGAGGSW